MIDKFPITCLIIAIAWFVIGTVLFYTVGVSLMPEGGIDSIGGALFYIMVWRALTWFPPIIIMIVGLLKFLHGKARPVFYIICAVAVVIIIASLIWNYLVKPIVYSPEYMARNTETYSEFYERLNDVEKIEHTESDRSQHYYGLQIKNMLTKCKWVDTKSEAEKYIAAIMDYRKDERELAGWFYVPDVREWLGEDDNPDYFRLTYAQCEKVAKSVGYTWNDNHYGVHGPDIDKKYPLVVIIYKDGTMDPLSQFYTGEITE